MIDNENNSFTQSDFENAQLAFTLWQSSQHESVDEYMMRKRKIELNALVREVIDNELCDKDRTIVYLHWFDGKTINQISQALELDRSNISRRLDKINDIIYDKLKYALQYRYGKDYSQSARVIIKNKDAFCVLPGKEDTLNHRIKNLRLSQGMTLRDTQDMTGIKESRLRAIENAECQVTAEDVRLIATAFKTSGDYIIFGKKKGDFANGFIN